jgi:Flp pilus assembly pilin Flp
MNSSHRGQATTEYALILLVAALVAIAAIGWATAGGGAGRVGSLFDSMFGEVLNRVGAQQ